MFLLKIHEFLDFTKFPFIHYLHSINGEIFEQTAQFLNGSRFPLKIKVEWIFLPSESKTL